MRRADLCATAFRSHLGCTKCRHLPSVQRLLLSLFYLSLLSGVVTNGSADDRRLGQGAVPQASVESRQIRLPIMDGADIRFARFYTIEGPSKSNAGPFVQDDQGFVWFGTPYGLNRFDGYNFKVFTHAPGNPKSISGSSITALFKDHNGSLWVGCNQFLNKFDSKTEAFTRYRVSYVFHISQDAAGTLWLSTPSGLYSLDPANGNIRRYFHDPDDPASLESNDVKSSGEDREGGFWVATSEGLDSFDRRIGKVTLHIPLYEPSYPFSFYEDRFGVFWIYHVSANPLSVFDRKTHTLTHFSFHEENSPGLALTGITGMLEDQNGALWLSSNGAGLLKFDREHRRFIRYRNSLADPESLAQNSVREVFADQEGIIWASLGGFGLTRFTSRPLPFQRYRHDFGNPASRDEPFVGAIYEDHQGILWIGTHEALNRIDRKAERYDAFSLTAAGEGTDVITICEDRRGYLWVGTYSHGLFRFDPRTALFKRFQHNPRDPHSLSNNIVPRLLVDHNGTLWAATHDGLDHFDAATGTFTTYRAGLQGVHPNYLELVEDRNGILWLGTESSGLLRFDPETGQFMIYQHDIERQGTLSNPRVNSVHFDRPGSMWIGTQEGLNSFDVRTGRFTTYSQREGLPGNVVGCVLEDNHGYLWMSTDNGVARFDPQAKTFRTYSTADGLPGPDLTGWGTCFKSANGEMFFGGFGGATAFFPDKVTDNSYVPPIVLTDFRLFGTSVMPGVDSPLKIAINHTDRIRLSHKQNSFSIGYSALSYLNPPTNRYRYMLQGLDREWNEVGRDQRFATYTTLPAGKYTFRVEGATNRGPWDEPGATLLIEILPAWWNSRWFRLTYITALLLVAAAIYIYRRRKQKREEERSDRLRQAQADLAHINRVSTMGELTASLAHEVNQPIAAIITSAGTCLRWLSRDQPDLEKARAAASRIEQDGKRASEIVNRVRLLFKKEPMQRELVDLNETIREMMLLLDSEATKFAVFVRTELAADLPQVMGDRVQLQQVLMNLMMNSIDAMKDVDGTRELTIQSQQGENGQVLISVNDTGVGLAPQQADKIFNAFFTTKPHGTGMGLRISRSIIESHGGRLWAADNSPRGANFQFTLPAATVATHI
jgi:signal transduction histidine kinase/ligand-binding sensor domain-containing protein